MHGPKLLTVRASDGLALAVEDCGPREWASEGRSALFCLAGLTRSSRDFHTLRDHFAFHPSAPRRVVLMDARGRGRSGRASAPKDYGLMQEVDDAASVAVAVGLHACVVIGTSRGGILAMVLALTRAALVRGSVMNDIGPRIALRGLLRLKSQLGQRTLPRNWDEAGALLKAGMGHQFPAFEEADWQEFARTTFRDLSGVPVADFDPAILADLGAISSQSAPPDLSRPFRALARKPMLMLRGQYSDLIDEQIEAHALALSDGRMKTHLVPGEGHAPALRGQTLAALESFLNRQGL